MALSKIILEKAGFDVSAAESGDEALLLIDKIPTPPDLILLDVRMDDMSGPEFLLILEEKYPDIFDRSPVVFLTALDELPASKAVGYIRKPIDIEKFLTAVHHFVPFHVV